MNSIEITFDDMKVPDRTLPDGRWRIECPNCGSRRWLGPGCKECHNEKYIIVDPIEPIKPCVIEDHLWVIEIEGGSMHVRPKDPHTAVEQEAMRRYREAAGDDSFYAGVCHNSDDFVHLGLVGEIEVKIKYVDDSSPSGPWGPAEYGYYIEFEPVMADGNNGSQDPTNDSD